MRTVYVKPGTKVIIRNGKETVISNEEYVELSSEFNRRRCKPLAKSQIMKCELERLELMSKIKSEPSELETLRTENAILKKKLEEIKSIISS